jgi:hypothetical protein
VLQETGKKGIYTVGNKLNIYDSRLIAWLIETALQARAKGSAPLKDFLDSPIFFPFQIKSITGEILIAASQRLEIVRHGLDQDLILLKKI